MITMWSLLAVAGSIGAPRSAISGLIFLTPACAALMICSLYKTLVWAMTPVKKTEVIQKYAREVSDKIE